MVAALYAWLPAPRLDRQATAIKPLGNAVMEFAWVRNREGAHPGELGRDP